MFESRASRSGPKTQTPTSARVQRGIGTPQIVLVLDFFGRGKRTDCQQRSKIENEGRRRGRPGEYLYRAKHVQAAPLQGPSACIPHNLSASVRHPGSQNFLLIGSLHSECAA